MAKFYTITDKPDLMDEVSPKPPGVKDFVRCVIDVWRDTEGRVYVNWGARAKKFNPDDPRKELEAVDCKVTPNCKYDHKAVVVEPHELGGQQVKLTYKIRTFGLDVDSVEIISPGSDPDD